MTIRDAAQLQQSDRRLSALLEVLQATLDQGRHETIDFARLRELVCMLHRELQLHCDLLEEDDYLSEVELHAPHLHKRLLVLQSEEHGNLQDIEVIINELASPDREVQCHGAHRLERSLRRIQHHENQKAHVVLDAFNVDAGAMD